MVSKQLQLLKSITECSISCSLKQNFITSFFDVFKSPKFLVLICISCQNYGLQFCHTLFNLQGTHVGFFRRPAFTAELHSSTFVLLLSRLFFNFRRFISLPPWRELVYNNTSLSSCQAVFALFFSLFELYFTRIFLSLNIV